MSNFVVFTDQVQFYFLTARKYSPSCLLPFFLCTFRVTLQKTKLTNTLYFLS